MTNRNSRSGTACALPLGWCARDRIEGAELVEAGTWRLATLGNGTLDSRNIVLRPWPESQRPLESGEVRMGLRCAGVNFRDVLIALGDPADTASASKVPASFSRSPTMCSGSRQATA